MRAPLTALLLLCACQEPFGTDRHDLVGFRVAAVQVQPVGEQLSARAAVIVDGRPWSDARVAMSWHLIDDLSTDTIASLDLDDADAYGAAPTLDRWTTGAGLALVAVSGDDTSRAVVALDPSLGAPPAPTRIDVFDLGLHLDDVEAASLDLEARRAMPDRAPATEVEPGAFLRLRVDVDDDTRVRWMSTTPTGTFLELDRRTTDWVSGDLVLDDDEIEEREVQAAGPRTLLALALDPAEAGANSWLTHDLWVGEAPTGVRTTSGRWLATDAAAAGPFVQGTLTAADDHPTGVQLTAVGPADAETDPGTAGLPCATPVSGPFEPDWLLEQRCTRQDVLGATVVVAIR